MAKAAAHVETVAMEIVPAAQAAAAATGTAQVRAVHEEVVLGCAVDRAMAVEAECAVAALLGGQDLATATAKGMAAAVATMAADVVPGAAQAVVAAEEEGRTQQK